VSRTTIAAAASQVRDGNGRPKNDSAAPTAVYSAVIRIVAGWREDHGDAESQRRHRDL